MAPGRGVGGGRHKPTANGTEVPLRSHRHHQSTGRACERQAAFADGRPRLRTAGGAFGRQAALADGQAALGRPVVRNGGDEWTVEVETLQRLA